MDKNKKVYLDYAATTPIAKEVMEEMLLYLKDNFGNPSSIHSFGQKSQEAIDKAKEQVAGFLNCSESEVIFTGSATEANNMALFGIAKHGTHIITTKIEHSAILEPCKQLEKQGVEITYLPVDKDGLVKVFALENAIKENTILVSIMYANNEVGTIQPIVEIGKLIQKTNSSSKFQVPSSKILFHTDAVQAINYLDCDVEKLGVDLLTLSGHKIYGPKGVGALYIKKGVKINPIIFGGGQEQGLRPGTQNVAGIVGLGKAIEQVPSSKFQVSRITELRDKLIEGILKNVSDSKLNGSRENRLPNNVNFSFNGVEGESIVIALDQEGIATATGSACSSRSLEPSHVLLAMGLSAEEAHSSLRLTLGRYTTEEEIDKVLEVLPAIINRLRKISGYNENHSR